MDNFKSLELKSSSLGHDLYLKNRCDKLLFLFVVVDLYPFT